MIPIIGYVLQHPMMGDMMDRNYSTVGVGILMLIVMIYFIHVYLVNHLTMVTLMMLLLPIALVYADAFGLRIGEIVEDKI